MDGTPKTLLVGGGQAYYGPTGERDKKVVEEVAKELFNQCGNSIEIVTGGMPGIPMDFARVWLLAGGTHVRFIVSEEHMATVTETMTGVKYEVRGKTQAERRVALTGLQDLHAALFVQGGEYTTDEIIKCQTRGIPVICFIGSGGASGGQIAYKGQLPVLDTDEPSEWIRNADPDADTATLAAQLTYRLRVSLFGD
jgi:predicted Rossmann-fold nucleotide-binding protein